MFAYNGSVSIALLEYLVSSSGEVLLETIRVLGNLSKYDWMRRTIAANKGTIIIIVIISSCGVVDELLVTLLDSKDLALVYAACGVLVNLLVDGRHRHTITNNSGLRKYRPLRCSLLCSTLLLGWSTCWHTLGGETGSCLV